MRICMTVLIMMTFISNQRTSRLVVSSILMLRQPSTSKSIMIPNDLDEEIEITWEVLKPQLILNKKTWNPHYRLFLP
jgi:hypothetical protein